MYNNVVLVNITLSWYNFILVIKMLLTIMCVMSRVGVSDNRTWERNLQAWNSEKVKSKVSAVTVTSHFSR